MDELVRALSRFIARDVLFIVGGSTVITSFLYTFDRFPVSELPVPYYFFGASLAYVLGYAIQEIFALTPVLTMADYFVPNTFVRWLYWRSAKEPWQPIPRFDTYQADVAIRSRESARLAFLERIVSMRQVGSTMGSCSLVSAIPLVVRAWVQPAKTPQLDLFLALSAAGIGVGLICLSWLKGAQQMRYMEAIRSAEARDGAADDPIRS